MSRKIVTCPMCFDTDCTPRRPGRLGDRRCQVCGCEFNWIALAAPPDLRIENHGSIFLFRPCTARAARWLRNTAPKDAQFICGAMVVEPRYVEGVLNVARDFGLNI